MLRTSWSILCVAGFATNPPSVAAADLNVGNNAIDLPTLEVTGSRLRRSDALTSSPVEVITREDIARSGKQNLSDVVRSLTMDNNGSISLGNVSGFAQGASGVALRGLAVSATLVLINGRRMVDYGLADDGQRMFVNLSNIPLNVVERVEVLKDGGSAVYGSDAIAGVVNIILLSRFAGQSGEASYSVSEYGDGRTPRISAMIGRGDPETDRYNVFLSVEASRQNPVYAANRSDRAWIGNGDLRPYGYDIAAGGSGPNISGWFNNATGAINSNPYGAVSNASLSTPIWQQLPGCNSAISLPPAYGGCAWDRVRQTGYILPAEEKLNLYMRGSFRASAAINPYVEVGRFRSDVSSNWVLGTTSANESWVDPATNSVINNAVLYLPASHPDNPLGVTARLNYLIPDVGSRTFDDDTVAYRTVLGCAGLVADWYYDAGMLYGHDLTERTVNGFVRNSVLQAGLNGTGAFGYYRLGINSGLNSPSLDAALSPTLSSDNTSSLTLMDFKASRSWFDLSGGPLATSWGIEFRRQALDAPPLPYTQAGDIIGWSYYAYSGNERVVSVHAEGEAPVSRHLDLDVAVRVEKIEGYSTAATPKAGFRWTPADALTLRGTYSQGYRAPNAVEKGPGNQNSGTLDMTGNGFLGVFRNLSNPDLLPERSRMLTLGPVLAPSSSQSLGLNFWWLKRSNEINLPDPFAILAGATGWPGAQVVKDSEGDVLELSAPYENNSTSHLRGVDLEMRNEVRLDRLGTLSASLNWTLLASYKKTFADGITYQYAGTHGPMAISGDTGTPRNKGNLLLAWAQAGAVVSANLSYVSGFLNTDHEGGSCASSFANGSPAPAGCRIGEFASIDVHLSDQVTPSTRISFSVTNILDRIAPLDPSGYINLNFDPSMHLDGAIGRTFTIGLKHDF